MPDFCTFGREMLLQRRLCDEERLPRHAYLPFGDGPRICIGNHFALMERQLILATLVQHVTFDLLARQRIEPEPLVTLRPRHGIKVIVERS